MAKLICPHCGAFTAFSPAQVLGKGVLIGRSHEDYTEWGKVQVSAIIPHDYDNSDHVYAILVCRACEQYFIAERKEYADDWLAVHPIQHKVVPDDIPPPIKGEFEEAALCFAVKAYRACVSMCQIALEHVWQEQHISGLAELEAKGIISSALYGRANEIRLWGNLEKHQLIMDKVLGEDAEQLLGYLEILLNEVYSEPGHLDRLAKKRKALNKKDKTSTGS